jgi:hypothetical protein
MKVIVPLPIVAEQRKAIERLAVFFSKGLVELVPVNPL